MTNKTPNHLLKFIVVLFSLFIMMVSNAMEVPIYDFPLNSYSQNANDFLSPDSEGYNKSLLNSDYQSEQLKQFYNHYYSSDSLGLSPWSEHMIMSVLPLMKKVELEVLESFNNQNKTDTEKHYGENFKEHDLNWWNKIKENMDLTAISSSEFKEENKAIAVTNTQARALPELAPDFYHLSLPGQGFPFDNLQESSIWAGTPLYVFSLSKDKAWSLVLTPDGYFAWVKSTEIAFVSSAFINQWQEAAHRALIAVTQTEVSILNTQEQYQFTGYIGAVFPMVQRNSQQTAILIPVKNNNNQAVIKTGMINTDASSIMPLIASPKNLVKVINQLKNRPYGWGGIYFYNDCSQELKSLFTPFGIWLPRNSTQQAKLNSGLDLSENSMDERLNSLKEKGHPLMTLISIKGHVMLYVGNNATNENEEVALTYQNVWGLAPKNKDKRYIIGQSVFLPLLKQYPENTEIDSLAGGPVFKLVYLDQLNQGPESSNSFINKYLTQRFSNRM